MRKTLFSLIALALSFSATLATAAQATDKMDSEVADRVTNEPVSKSDIQKMEAAKFLGLTTPSQGVKTMVATR